MFQRRSGSPRPLATAGKIWHVSIAMDLPESSSILRLVGVYGRLRARLRAEISAPRLVLPNAEFFPDHFDGSASGTQRLVRRMQQHAGISDIPLKAVVDVEGNAASQCSSGGCGPSAPINGFQPRLVSHDEQWLLHLQPGEVAHPVGLTTLVAQALGLVFLEETRPESGALPEPIALYQELAAVQLGFGVLLLEGAHVYSKGCGGPRVSQLTMLSAPELAVLVALFAADHKTGLKSALRVTSPTQRALLDEAEALLRGNAGLLTWTRSATAADPDPHLALAPPKRALFGGLLELGRNRRTGVDPEDLEAELERELSGARALPAAKPGKVGSKALAVDDDLKALVAEALQK